MGVTLDHHFHAAASGWDRPGAGRRPESLHLAPQRHGGCACGAHNTDEAPVARGSQGLPWIARFADTLKRIGFAGDVCTVEVFRPDYYQLSQQENAARHAPAPMWPKYWEARGAP